jgi:hypothetical protein
MLGFKIVFNIKGVQLSQRIKSLDTERRKENRVSSLLNSDQIRVQIKESQFAKQHLPPPPPPPRQPPPSLDTYVNNVDTNVHYNQPWAVNLTQSNAMSPFTTTLNHYKLQHHPPSVATISHASHMNYQMQALTNEQKIIIFNQQLLDQQLTHNHGSNQKQLSYVYHLVPIAVPSNDVEPLLHFNNISNSNNNTYARKHPNIQFVQTFNGWPNNLQANTNDIIPNNIQADIVTSEYLASNTLNCTEEASENTLLDDNKSDQLYISETSST